MIIFLGFTFIAMIVLVVAYVLRGKNSRSNSAQDHVFELHDSWKGVNEVDCECLVGPDVTNAARAMTITASLWLNGLVTR